MLYFCHNFTKYGPLAQLGERLTGSQEVVGSIPIGSTIFDFCVKQCSTPIEAIVNRL